MSRSDLSVAVVINKAVDRYKYLVGTSASLRRDLLRGVGGMAGVKLINLALAFTSSILVARSLGPEGYGAYAFIMSLVSSIALLSCLGLPALMVREIAKYEQSQKWGLIRGFLHKGHLFVTGIVILLMLLVAMASIIFATSAELDRWRLLLIALPLIPVFALTSLRASTLRGFRKVILGAIPEMFIRPVIFLMALLWLLFIGKATVEAVIVAQVGAALGALSVGILLCRRVVARNVKNATLEYNNQEWLSALLPFMGLAGVSFLNVEFINIFLGFSGTNQDVAMFRAAANIALIVALPLALIETVISPYITRLYHAGELGKLQKLTQVASLAALLFSALPAIALLIFGTETIKIIYGSDYTSAFGTLVVIVLGYMIVNLVGLSMQLLYATEYHASAFRISAYGALVTVLLCLFLIPFFGALGAGIALGFGKALRAAFFVIEARRCLKIKTSLIW
jgi:O-antigen/teichoic acid export membrane protein